MSMDPEPPTRRIPPTGPVQAGPPGAPPYPPEEDLYDQIRKLRTWLAVAATLAVLALGVAVWALLTSEEESDTQAGASRSSVTRLDERVDDLEEQVDDRATKSSVSSLRSDVSDLTEQVDELGKAAEGGDDTEQIQESVDELSQQVSDLEQRVEQAEQTGGEQAP